ncbi:MAG: hypothetical protein QOI66_2421 [Myxococcales bacterium]|jgi:hypothetical protein|nr:hypothetical protein [Myxococcales bacterium]
MSIQERVLWLSRRAFLGGAGTLVALPFLQSLAPRRARAAGATPPKRFLSWYWACGIPAIGDWKPTTYGMNWQPSMLLTPLAPMKNKVTVLSGLKNAGHGPDHTYGTGAFLTGSDFANGKINQSIDQVIADSMQAAPSKPPIHSMQLGPLDTNCEPFGNCGFLQNVSFGPTGTPITKETDAQNAFNRLFMGASPMASDPAIKARQALRKSVLDAVNKDATSLSGLLGKDDKARFDEYLTSVRKVEDQVSAIGAGGGGTAMSCSGAKMPNGLTMTAKPVGDLLESEINAFTSVMALALQCDMTRVISFMMTAGGTKYAPMGYTDYHLGITHHGVSDWQPKFRTVVTWIVTKFTQFLQQLDAIKDVDGVSSILDNTVVFCSSEISDGNRHNHDDMPVLLAGGLGGIIKPGQHIQFSKGEYFADLFMWIAKNMGVPPMTKFGDTGTGKIASLV